MRRTLRVNRHFEFKPCDLEHRRPKQAFLILFDLVQKFVDHHTDSLGKIGVIKLDEDLVSNKDTVVGV